MRGVLSKFSRDDESEADRLGFVLAVKAGFSPEGASRAMEKFSEINPEGDEAGYSSSHPGTKERIRRLREYSVAYRNGVPLELIALGKTTRDLNDLIGGEPEFEASRGALMTICLNRPPLDYRKSDLLRFSIQAHSKGFLSIFSMNSDGVCNTLFPNVYNRDSQVQSEAKIDVPSPHYRTSSGEMVRLRWDRTGKNSLFFILSEKAIDSETLVGKGNDKAAWRNRLTKLVTSSENSLLDFAEISVDVK
jgi:hypothetical protein